MYPLMMQVFGKICILEYQSSIPDGGKILFYHHVQTGFEVYPPYYPIVMGASSRQIKYPEHEANHSHPPCSKAKKAYS
jgi:hypothetical protein